MNLIKNYPLKKIDMALFASKLILGLKAKEEVIDYINQLLNEGFYTDAMLEIIDSDPLYPIEGLDKKFNACINAFGVKTQTLTQAKWLFSFSEISHYATKPYNFRIFAHNHNTNIYLTFASFFDDDSAFQDISDFQTILYQLDDVECSRFNEYIQQGYNDDHTMYRLKCQFFEACEQWLQRNKTTIIQIFDNLI